VLTPTNQIERGTDWRLFQVRVTRVQLRVALVEVALQHRAADVKHDLDNLAEQRR
jgi:hypothetical protein